jgi:hypothetical protein
VSQFYIITFETNNHIKRFRRDRVTLLEAEEENLRMEQLRLEEEKLRDERKKESVKVSAFKM